MNIFGIHWATTHYFWFSPVLLTAVCCMAWRTSKWHSAITLLRGMAPELIKNSSLPKQFIKTISASFALLFILLALLSPQWNEQETVAVHQGRQLMVALDISRSMLATDVHPNRLQLAKSKVKALLNALDCERIGLILFSGSAFVQCPLTADFKSFSLLLDHVDVETISSGSTSLEEAIKKSLNVYEQLPNQSSKLLLLITDGEDFSQNLSTYKHQAQEADMHIFSLGVGTEQGAPVPLFDSAGNQIGHQRDSNGSVVISHLNESTLRSLSQEAGGTYLSASTHNHDDIKHIVHCVQQFEKETFEDRSVKHHEDQYHWFLLAAFILLLIEWLL